MKNGKPKTLSPIERAGVERLQAREAELQREMAKLSEDYAWVKALLEERMGFEEGAIGTTHQINTATWEVSEMAEHVAS